MNEPNQNESTSQKAPVQSAQNTPSGSLSEKPDHEHLINTPILIRGEDTTTSAKKKPPTAAQLIEHEQLKPDDLDEQNVVEPVWEKQLAKKPENLRLTAEEKRISVESLSEQSTNQDGLIANFLAGGPNPQSHVRTEQEKKRQLELIDLVHNQFRVEGAKFHFKDQGQKLAFKDKGERMVSASNDDRVAKAMVTLADAKAWKTIKVSGHPDFRREVWKEASLRGIEVRGYKPTEQDLKMLTDKEERSMQNIVEKAEISWKSKALAPVSEKGVSPFQDNAKRTHALASKERTHEGKLLEHGSAKFNHDPNAKENYFVKLATSKGEKTIWGVDLKRMMSESNLKDGDDIKIKFQGRIPVTVETLKWDETGKIIGKEEITAHRNTWEAQKSDRGKVVEAIAWALIDSKVKDPMQREALKAAVGDRIVLREKINKVPIVPVYDKSAPTKNLQERTGPVVERTSERTR